MKKIEDMTMEELMKLYEGHTFTYLKGGSKKLMGVTESGELAYIPLSESDKAEKKEFDKIADALVCKFLDMHSSRSLPERVIGAESVAATVTPEIREMAEKICEVAAKKYDYFTLQSVFQRMQPAWVFDKPVEQRLIGVCKEILPRVALFGETSLAPRIERFAEIFGLKSTDKAKMLRAYKAGLKESQKSIMTQIDFDYTDIIEKE